MTIEEMQTSKSIYLSVSEVASVLHCDPQALRVQAHTNPQALGYPVIIIGRRVRIPRIPFLHYLGYKE